MSDFLSSYTQPKPPAPTIDETDGFSAPKPTMQGVGPENITPTIESVQKQMIEEEKDYLKRMLANIPPHVSPEAIATVRKKLEDLEAGRPSQVVQSVEKVKKTTVEDLLAASDDDLDKLAAQFTVHARKQLKGR